MLSITTWGNFFLRKHIHDKGSHVNSRNRKVLTSLLPMYRSMSCSRTGAFDLLRISFAAAATIWESSLTIQKQRLGDYLCLSEWAAFRSVSEPSRQRAHDQARLSTRHMSRVAHSATLEEIPVGVLIVWRNANSFRGGWWRVTPRK